MKQNQHHRHVPTEVRRAEMRKVRAPGWAITCSMNLSMSSSQRPSATHLQFYELDLLTHCKQELCESQDISVRGY